MCQVSWCNKETEFYNKSQRYKFCSTHRKYKEWVRNAPSRPWLMYKLEKILKGEGTICEICKDDLQKRKRIKNIVPSNDRCIALRANLEQCTRRKKEGRHVPSWTSWASGTWLAR